MLFLLLACGSNNDFFATHENVVYGIANIDDDDGNGTQDWDDSLVDEENDLASFIIPQDYYDDLSKKESLRLRQNSDGFRIYLDGKLKTNSQDDLFTLDDGDTLIEIEMKTSNTSGTFTLERVKDGEVVDSTDIELFSAPMLINHHLQPFEQIYAMNGDNAGFISGFEAALGDNFTSYTLRDYDWDVWLQDEVEFGNLYSPDSRMDIVIDSIRDRGLDPLPEEQWEGPDMPVLTWGSAQANSQDSFGNLEASPPVTVNGVEYPLGRIYYGVFHYGSTDYTMVDELADEFSRQVVQEPFLLDIGFLCVGHVDEFITFIPDASSAKGFKLLITDVNEGYEFFESLDQNMSLPKYGVKGYSTVGDIMADNALRGLNEDIQLDYLDPAWETLQAELGLTEDDVIRVPMLFEEAPQCGGGTATLLPGSVNMVVATGADGASADLILPDPYFRTSTSDQSSDPFIEMFNSLLPEGNTPHWVDDWDSYHMMLGEVHCGSNTLRTPMENNWVLAHNALEAK